MSNNHHHQTLSLLRSLIQSKRFDQGTLRILDSVLISRDVKSMLDVRKSLVEYMRRESVNVIREVVAKTVEEKLLIVEFFVKAFAVIGDMESCLALTYEALVMRELNSVSDHQLHVSYEEWFTFAEHALENRFSVIARKACEKALGCFQMDDMLKTKDRETLREQTEAIRKINRLKEIAMVRAASQSVQAQAVTYLKRKIGEHDKVSPQVIKEQRVSASILFRNGIKKHNTRKLQELQRL